MSTPSQRLKITQYKLMASTVIWPHLHSHIHVHTHTHAHTHNAHTLCTYSFLKKENLYSEWIE